MKISFKMNYKNEGLTVGELTIAISALIIIFLIWSGISKQKDSNTSFIPTYNNLDLIDKT